jgi:hypothetical protein
MAVGDGLSVSEPLNVKARNGWMLNQKLSFGDYQTQKVNRWWTEGSELKGGAMEVLSVSYSQKSKAFISR